LEDNLSQTKSTLTKTQVAKEELKVKFAKIEARAAAFHSKINALKKIIDSLFSDVGDLSIDNSSDA